MREKKYNSVCDAFFALVRAGLWEREVQLLPYGEIDFSAVQSVAEEQSVVGLVAAGLEHVSDMKVPKKDALQFIGQILQLEQRNQAMNYFIGVIVDIIRKEGIYTVLVKGQGIAQCYAKPEWRACGDVDFFLSEENYEKAKAYLRPLASSLEEERMREKHLRMTIDPWVVELHGHLYSGLSSRIERELDAVLEDTLHGGNVRSWDNNGVQVFQLSVENDAFYVFTHILQHFYKGGIGLRQICDWCRLLWTYRVSLNLGLLESRIKNAGLMSEWKAFGAFAVDYLGMEASSVPFYSKASKWASKARKIRDFVLLSGNFGHNRDTSYYSKYPYVIRKCISFGRQIGDLFRHARVFPLDSLRFFPNLFINGVRSAARGEG